MTTYPPGRVLPYGAKQMVDGTDPNLWYTSPDGKSKFYIMGGLAPWPGVTPGIVCNEWPRGMSPSFKHLDLQGAHQDGTTWTDTVYDPMEIDLPLEAHGRTAQEISAVVSEWIGAWDPKKPGTLEYFTQDRGYWYCSARLFKVWADQIKQSPRRHKYMALNHACRVDDAFWKSIDSTSSFQLAYVDLVDDFNYTTTSGLGANWELIHSTGGSGFVYANGKRAVWGGTDNHNQTVTCRYKAAPTATDNQVVTIEFGRGWPLASFPSSATNDIWVRMGQDGSGNWDGNGVRLRISLTSIELTRFNNFAEKQLFWRPIAIPPLPGEKWSLVAGAVSGKPRTFSVLRRGITVQNITESGTVSMVGAAYRYGGMGFHSAAGLLFIVPEATPSSVERWEAADNLKVTQSGQLPLTNIGDQDGWPRYLAYGPFDQISIGNGTSTSDPITFGPLYDGQIALITSQPRLRGVVDLSPSAPQQTLSTEQKIVEALAGAIAGSNTPPLLAEWESQFGILPPQGPMYSLLNGRFTNPIPGVAQPSWAQTQYIPCTITGGTVNSQIIAALTPQRRWPE